RRPPGSALFPYATLFRSAALLARGRTGQGRVIDISLVDSMTRFLTCRIVPYLGSGEVPQRSGGKDSVIAIYQTFQTADEPITLGDRKSTRLNSSHVKISY